VSSVKLHAVRGCCVGTRAGMPFASTTGSGTGGSAGRVGPTADRTMGAAVPVDAEGPAPQLHKAGDVVVVVVAADTACRGDCAAGASAGDPPPRPRTKKDGLNGVGPVAAELPSENGGAALLLPGAPGAGAMRADGDMLGMGTALP